MKTSRSFLLVIIIGFGFMPFEICAQGVFRAAVLKSNITPSNSKNLLGYAPRMSDGVRDSIYHKVVILHDGNNEIVLVSSDLARVSPSVYERVANKLHKLTKIEKKDFWWTFTHTHSAPEVGPSEVVQLFLPERYEKPFDKEYTDFIEESLIRTIMEARENLVPARMGIGWGFSNANVNRRARDIDNKTFLGENPDGPIDRRIGLIRIDDEQNRPIVLISNYPIHPTVLPANGTKISGEIPGVVAEYIENQIGAPLLFINGAEGNIGPRFSVSVAGDKRADRFLNQFRELLGKKILEANEKIVSTTADVIFNTGSLIVETPMRNDLDINNWPKELGNYARKTSTGISMIKFPVSFLFINDDIAIWGTPSELFCEISNQIRENSPFPHTFYFGLTNGTLGYLPTKEEILLGGYEPSVSPFSPEAGDDLINEVSNYLNEKSLEKNLIIK
ncbi:MAG: neutral/alkaline non-lysosomal ceramidase N-terminal domain-containing protein [Anditalea sp.]